MCFIKKIKISITIVMNENFISGVRNKLGNFPYQRLKSRSWSLDQLGFFKKKTRQPMDVGPHKCIASYDGYPDLKSGNVKLFCLVAKA